MKKIIQACALMSSVLLMSAVASGPAQATVVGTPFEALADEVDERRTELATPANGTERRQKRAIKRVTRELAKVERGLKRDLRSAQKVSNKLNRAFPGDAEFGPLLDGMLDGYATVLSNRLFAAEDTLDEAEDPVRRQVADKSLDIARDFEVDAANAPTQKDRVRILRKLANRLITAEKAIAFVPPPPPPEPDDNPISDVVDGRVDYTINGATKATLAVDGDMTWDFQKLYYRVEGHPNTFQLGSIELSWTDFSTRFNAVRVVSDDEDDARVVIRRGNLVFDRNTSGEIQITRLKATQGEAELRGTYRVTASAADGQQISVTGSFDINSMPYAQRETQ